MKDIQQKLYQHPELGITHETVNGRNMYRHKGTPNTLGVWFPKEKVRQITDRIPQHVLPQYEAPQYEAECIVKIVQDFNLGEHALQTAQRNHYNALMGDKHQRLPQWAAREARDVAIKYGLGREAIQAAELACYNALMGDKHRRLPSAALEEAIEAVQEFFIKPAQKRLATLHK